MAELAPPRPRGDEVRARQTLEPRQLRSEGKPAPGALLHRGRGTVLAGHRETLHRGSHVAALQRAAAALGGVGTLVQRVAVVQRVEIEGLLGDADTGEEVAAQLGALIAHPPGDDEAEQTEFHDALVNAAGYWQRVGGNDIGAGAGANRLGLLAALHAADAPPTLQRLMRYYFGLGARPHEPARGIGTLRLTRNEGGGVSGIEGRPGLFAIRTGGAAQARRHITAWHTMRNLMNRIIAEFDAHDLSEIARRIVDVTDPHIGVEAADVARREVGEAGPDFHILWLAIVLNNVPHNLWLGAARENISINTLSGFIVRWTEELMRREITVEVYRQRLQNYNAGSPMARRIIAQLVAETNAAHVAEAGVYGPNVINEFVQRTVRPQLEIDPRRGDQISPLQRFLYEASEGHLVLHDLEEIAGPLAEFVATPDLDEGEGL